MSERPRFSLAGVPEQALEQIEHLADQAGFVDRRAPKPPPLRQRGTKAQLHNFCMRVEIDDAEAFIRYCERQRIPYREAFSKMVQAILREEQSS
jgi:hypothetical protein